MFVLNKGNFFISRIENVPRCKSQCTLQWFRISKGIAAQQWTKDSFFMKKKKEYKGEQM